MKKTLIAIFGIANFLFLLNTQLHAQYVATHSGQRKAFFEKPFSQESPIAEVSTKATRNFSKQFKNAENIHWYFIKGGVMAKFTQNGITSRADYTKKGTWLHNLRSYPVKFLPKEIRTRMKYAFIDYAITWVNEIESSNGIVYMINIEDETEIKIIRIYKDELDVMSEYMKS